MKPVLQVALSDVDATLDALIAASVELDRLAGHALIDRYYGPGDDAQLDERSRRLSAAAITLTHLRDEVRDALGSALEEF